MIDLTAAGLSPTEAKCYTALLEQQDWTPAELAKYVTETRTNCYKILDNLVALKLAERFDKAKKLHYRATNPAQLLELARKRRTAQEKAERALQANTEDLMKTYYNTHEQAGVRYFQGETEIKQIFEEIAEAKDEVKFIHTLAGIDFYGFDTMHDLRMLSIKNGVKRRALTQDGPQAPTDYKTADPFSNLQRTWLKADDYKTPVEWGAFDDKLYIISFGKEALGIIIESPQIAAAFKELFVLVDRGQRLLPDYAQLPLQATATSRIER